MRTIRILAAASALAAHALLALPSPAAPKKVVTMPTPEQIKMIEAACPDKPAVAPAAPRKVLVYGKLSTHEPNPFAAEALKALGRKSGAFEAVVSDDPNLLLPERIREFDAVVMNNLHEREPFLPANLKELPADRQQAARQRDQEAKKSVLAYVAGGKGVVGIHAATACCQNWPEYGRMIGGYYGGHIVQEVPIKLDEPAHGLNACFEGKGFRIRDEIYIFRDPYSRRDLRVIASLDLSQMDDPGKRPDKDYAVSWVRPYGKGRVFYCSLGHMAETYWDSRFLKHVLAGIQFAIGDLKAEAAPVAGAGDAGAGGAGK